MCVCDVSIRDYDSMRADGLLLLQWVYLRTGHFDFIRTTVTQAERLCYDGAACSFSWEIIQGLFTDSSNTTDAAAYSFERCLWSSYDAHALCYLWL